MDNVIRFDTDENIHEKCPTRRVGHCRACVEGYPKAHGVVGEARDRNTKVCAGQLHAEIRYDMEAGFKWAYLYSRCDSCNSVASEEIKQGHPLFATAFKKKEGQDDGL